MKIHEPKKVEGYICPECYCDEANGLYPIFPSRELSWTRKGWICFDCVEGCDAMALYPSESPEWDGKTLEEYLDDLVT